MTQLPRDSYTQLTAWTALVICVGSVLLVAAILTEVSLVMWRCCEPGPVGKKASPV